MTRLQPHDILGIPSQLQAYDAELLARTGHTLRQIACRALELAEEDSRGIIPGIRVGVVPIRWGQGVIEGFCQATAGILKHLGFDTFVTRQADLPGLIEACQAMADVVFLSDDNDFVALNTRTRQHIHNAEATGKGFAAGLDLMAGGVAGQKVLVLGCGAVGRSTIASLIKYGAKVSIYDINSRSCLETVDSFTGSDSARITIEQDLHQALSRHALVVDATNAAEIIRARDISPQTFIAAPGMPLGVSAGALRELSDRLLHDPLQIGVATMGMAGVKQLIHRQ